MNKEKLNILVLDGGGSKGVYTIGVLKELELRLGSPLCEHFGLVFGTSTGSIIASLIALGFEISRIEELYLNIVPIVMKKRSKRRRSKALREEIIKIIGSKKFDAFKTNIGNCCFKF